jgi:Uncharacterized protein conserved in bacteria
MNIESILDFWFGTDPDDAVVAKEQAKLWWSKNGETDDEMRRRFEDAVQSATTGELNEWLATARGRLALIILTDQFPRNIYRERPGRSPATQKRSRGASTASMVVFDRELRPIEKVFFYLPLEHAESREHQAKSVECFSELAASVPMEQRSTFEEYLDFAMRHRDIIDRFGRFPHRNNILRRESTPEELAFLTQSGSFF